MNHVVFDHCNANSPPDNGGLGNYYVHRYQIDLSLVIEDSRIFTLINPECVEPHHIILNRAMGALKIPIGTFNRSISDK